MARRSTGKGKPRPVSFGYWREAASGRIHGHVRPRCAAGAGELFPCRLTRPQWDAALRCECAVWWASADGPAVVVQVEDAAPASSCASCGASVVDGEGSSECETADGVTRCLRCAAAERRPASALSISYGSTVVARVEGPAEVERTATASADELAALRVEVRKNPFLVTSKQIEDASRARLHRRREGLPCPLCEVPAGCACTARQLAVWASRQLTLPMEIPAAPSIGAKSGSQGVLW